MIEYHYAIVELQAPNHDQALTWASCSLPKLSLMQQEAFRHLQDEGPWLLSLDGDVSAQLGDLQGLVGDQAILGWISSFLPAEKLGQHLSHALVAKVPSGSTVLLRSYSPQVLPALHAREDCAWHESLFGPINVWSLKIDEQVHHFKGREDMLLPEYQDIVLDELLLEALAVDQQALALLEEMESSAEHVFISDCYGERLRLVEQALNCARNTGLKHPDDHLLFATLSLLEGVPLDSTAYWPDVLNEVLDHGAALSEALENQVGDDSV